MRGLRLLAMGTYDVRTHPRVGVLLEGMAQRGARVRQLNEPLGVGTAGRVEALRSPVAAARFAGRLAGKWGRLAAGSRAYRGRYRPDAVLVGYLGHFDVLLARALFPRTTIVLDHLIFAADTAADRGLAGKNFAGRVKDVLLRGLDRAAIAAADVVAVDTAEHLAMVPDRHRGKGVVVPVGAPDRWFEAGDEGVGVAGAGAPGTAGGHETGAVPDARAQGDGRPRAIFFGLFTPLQGAPVIAAALAELEARGVGLDVTLVGDGQDADCVRELLPEAGRHVRVTWLDWVDDLAPLVAAHDICLGIFGTSAKARRVVPNKAYQGLAAGCALITSDTAAQRSVLADGAVYVPAGDATALADALARLTDPAALAEAKRRSRAAAGAFRPRDVTGALARTLEAAS
ncbi:MAG: glycosyltransferase [Actinomycetaceae bacterium]|nr:glycosyltransferase [Actinomycetaceae bacterium]